MDKAKIARNRPEFASHTDAPQELLRPDSAPTNPRPALGAHEKTAMSLPNFLSSVIGASKNVVSSLWNQKEDTNLIALIQRRSQVLEFFAEVYPVENRIGKRRPEDLERDPFVQAMQRVSPETKAVVEKILLAKPNVIEPSLDETKALFDSAALEAFLAEFEKTREEIARSDPGYVRQSSLEAGMLHLTQVDGELRILAEVRQAVEGGEVEARPEWVKGAEQYREELKARGELYQIIREDLELALSDAELEQESLALAGEEYSADLGDGEADEPRPTVQEGPSEAVRAARQKLALFNGLLEELEGLEFSAADLAFGLEELEGVTKDLRAYEEEWVYQELERQLSSVENLDERHPKVREFQVALAALREQESPSLQDYQFVLGKSQEAALWTSVEERIRLYTEMHESAGLTDGIIALGKETWKGLQIGLGGPLAYERLRQELPTDIDGASPYLEMQTRFIEVHRHLTEGNDAAAQRLFVRLENSREHQGLLEGFKDSQRVNQCTVTAAIVTASAATAGLATELVGGAAIALGMSRGLNLLKFATNATAFTVAERRYTTWVHGRSFFDPKLSGTENLKHLSFDTAMNAGMFAFLGKAFRLFEMNIVLPLARSRALVKLGGIESRLSSELLEREREILLQNLLTGVPLRLGRFTTELLAFGGWDGIAKNIHHNAERIGTGESLDFVLPIDELLSKEAWEERFIFLIALKAGGILAAPVTKPLQEAARSWALRRHENSLAAMKIDPTSAPMDAILKRGESAANQGKSEGLAMEYPQGGPSWKYSGPKAIRDILPTWFTGLSLFFGFIGDALAGPAKDLYLKGSKSPVRMHEEVPDSASLEQIPVKDSIGGAEVAMMLGLAGVTLFGIRLSKRLFRKKSSKPFWLRQVLVKLRPKSRPLSQLDPLPKPFSGHVSPYDQLQAKIPSEVLPYFQSVVRNVLQSFTHRPPGKNLRLHINSKTGETIPAHLAKLMNEIHGGLIEVGFELKGGRWFLGETDLRGLISLYQTFVEPGRRAVLLGLMSFASVDPLLRAVEDLQTKRLGMKHPGSRRSLSVRRGTIVGMPPAPKPGSHFAAGVAIPDSPGWGVEFQDILQVLDPKAKTQPAYGRVLQVALHRKTLRGHYLGLVPITVDLRKALPPEAEIVQVRLEAEAGEFFWKRGLVVRLFDGYSPVRGGHDGVEGKNTFLPDWESALELLPASVREAVEFHGIGRFLIAADKLHRGEKYSAVDLYGLRPIEISNFFGKTDLDPGSSFALAVFYHLILAGSAKSASWAAQALTQSHDGMSLLEILAKQENRFAKIALHDFRNSSPFGMPFMIFDPQAPLGRLWSGIRRLIRGPDIESAELKALKPGEEDSRSLARINREASEAGGLFRGLSDFFHPQGAPARKWRRFLYEICRGFTNYPKDKGDDWLGLADIGDKLRAKIIKDDLRNRSEERGIKKISQEEYIDFALHAQNMGYSKSESIALNLKNATPAELEAWLDRLDLDPAAQASLIRAGKLECGRRRLWDILLHSEASPFERLEAALGLAEFGEGRMESELYILGMLPEIFQSTYSCLEILGALEKLGSRDRIQLLQEAWNELRAVTPIEKEHEGSPRAQNSNDTPDPYRETGVNVSGSVMVVWGGAMVRQQGSWELSDQGNEFIRRRFGTWRVSALGTKQGRKYLVLQRVSSGSEDSSSLRTVETLHFFPLETVTLKRRGGEDFLRVGEGEFRVGHEIFLMPQISGGSGKAPDLIGTMIHPFRRQGSLSQSAPASGKDFRIFQIDRVERDSRHRTILHLKYADRPSDFSFDADYKFLLETDLESVQSWKVGELVFFQPNTASAALAPAPLLPERVQALTAALRREFCDEQVSLNKRRQAIELYGAMHGKFYLHEAETLRGIHSLRALMKRPLWAREEVLEVYGALAARLEGSHPEVKEGLRMLREIHVASRPRGNLLKSTMRIYRSLALKLSPVDSPLAMEAEGLRQLISLFPTRMEPVEAYQGLLMRFGSEMELAKAEIQGIESLLASRELSRSVQNEAIAALKTLEAIQRSENLPNGEMFPVTEQGSLKYLLQVQADDAVHPERLWRLRSIGNGHIVLVPFQKLSSQAPLQVKHMKYSGRREDFREGSIVEIIPAIHGGVDLPKNPAIQFFPENLSVRTLEKGKNEALWLRKHELSLLSKLPGIWSVHKVFSVGSLPDHKVEVHSYGPGLNRGAPSREFRFVLDLEAAEKLGILEKTPSGAGYTLEKSPIKIIVAPESLPAATLPASRATAAAIPLETAASEFEDWEPIHSVDTLGRQFYLFAPHVRLPMGYAVPISAVLTIARTLTANVEGQNRFFEKGMEIFLQLAEDVRFRVGQKLWMLPAVWGASEKTPQIHEIPLDNVEVDELRELYRDYGEIKESGLHPFADGRLVLAMGSEREMFTLGSNVKVSNDLGLEGYVKLIQDPKIEQNHAQILRRPDGSYLLRNASRYSVEYLPFDGEPVSLRKRGQATVLRAGDRLMIGSTMIEFYVLGNSPYVGEFRAISQASGEKGSR